MASARQLFTGSAINCVRGGRVLFRDLSFSLAPGEMLHLSGANGAGKSSLLRIMAGLLPSSGKIQWGGDDFLENGIETHARRLAWLPQDDRSLKPQETVAETLRFWSQLWGGGDIRPALDDMGIAHLADVPVRHLSAGQKRRLSLARLLLKKAPLWLLDEPLNGLDGFSRLLFWQAAGLHAAAGGIAVIACHDAIDPPHRLIRLEVGR